MSIRHYLATMLIATLLGWGIWVMILFYIDPTVADLIGFIFFYTALFLSLLGTYFIISLFIKIKIIKHEEAAFRQTKKIFRQALIFSTYIIISLILLQKNLLNWWNAIILTVLYLFIEGTIITNHRRAQKYVK